MQLRITSWSPTGASTDATTDINDDTNFMAWYDAGQNLIPERSPIRTTRDNAAPKLAGMDTGGIDFMFKIKCLGTIHTQRETVKRYFSPENYRIGTLTFADTANGSKEWYLNGMPARVNEETPGVMAITLSLDEPYLREVTETTGTWSITASGQSTDFSVTGNLSANPILTITPTMGKTGGDYAYFRYVAVYNPINAAFTDYPFDFGGLDTAALASGNKMQADGDDMRLRIDGAEVNRWFGTTDGRGINTTDTAIWANIDLPAKTTLNLLTGVGSTEVTFSFDPFADNVSNAVLRLGNANNKALILNPGTTDEEVVTYNSVDIFSKTVTGITRGAKGTTATSHSAGTVMYHLPFDAWLVYGSSDATAPTVDDTRKPMFDLHSTNTSWIYSSFYDSTSASRTAQWSPIISKPGNGKQSGYYTDNHATNSNPAPEVGMSLKPYYYLGAYRTDNAEVLWRFANPAGVTTVQATGEKYRYASDWALVAGLQYYDDIAKKYVSADNQSTPGSAQSWTSFTIASTDTGNLTSGRKNIQFILSGSIIGSASNIQNLELDAATLTLDSNNIPQKSVGAEQSQYHLNATITNATTGDYIMLDFAMSLNRTLTVNCNTREIYYDDGTPAYNAISWSTYRDGWLPLVYGTNTLSFTDTGTQGVTIGVDYENRNTL